MFKRKLVEHAVPLSLMLGAIAFLLTYFRLTSSSLDELLSLGAAIGIFVIVAAACYLILNNVVDPYTFEVASAKQKLYRYLETLEKQSRMIRDDEVIALVVSIIDNTHQLISRTEAKTPNKVLSAVSILANWIETANTCIDQFIDIENNPRFHDQPRERLKQGKEALKSLETFLINSIKTLEAGDNLTFDVATKMLEATKFDLIS